MARSRPSTPPPASRGPTGRPGPASCRSSASCSLTPPAASTTNGNNSSAHLSRAKRPASRSRPAHSNSKRPDGRTAPVSMQSTPAGPEWSYTDTNVSGIYTLRGLPQNQSQQFAVNVDTTESDLGKVDPDDTSARARHSQHVARFKHGSHDGRPRPVLVESFVPVVRARAPVRRIVPGLAIRPGDSMSGRLPAWLAEWLGVRVPSTADGATWQLDSAWSWAPWATLLLMLAAILWTRRCSTLANQSGAGVPIARCSRSCDSRPSAWCSSCSPNGRSRCGSPVRRRSPW